jgi:hypothetical protein
MIGDTWTPKAGGTSIVVTAIVNGRVRFDVVRDAGGTSTGSVTLERWQDVGPPSWGWVRA